MQSWPWTAFSGSYHEGVVIAHLIWFLGLCSEAECEGDWLQHS